MKSICVIDFQMVLDKLLHLIVLHENAVNSALLVDEFMYSVELQQQLKQYSIMFSMPYLSPTAICRMFMMLNNKKSNLKFTLNCLGKQINKPFIKS